MMQLGDIAMEASPKTAANLQHAEEWYRRAATGDPSQPDAIFQIARIHHEVRYKCSGRRPRGVPPGSVLTARKLGGA